jgi:hypothetical protein
VQAAVERMEFALRIDPTGFGIEGAVSAFVGNTERQRFGSE